MLYFIWGIFNISISVYFIIICFKSIKVIRAKLGVLATLVFVFGVISFLNFKRPDEEIKKFDIRSKEVENLNKNYSKSITLFLEKKGITKIQLHTVFGKENNLLIPISSYSYISGFISGLRWIPTHIIIDSTNLKYKFRYSVFGSVEWNLFGFNIFTESKEYYGYIDVRQNYNKHNKVNLIDKY